MTVTMSTWSFLALISSCLQVFVDCGLVFGRLSQPAMEDCIAHVMELTPLNKVVQQCHRLSPFLGSRCSCSFNILQQNNSLWLWLPKWSLSVQVLWRKPHP